MMRPPNEPEPCFSESGISTGATEASVAGVTQDETDGGQKFLLVKPRACQSPGRPRYSASPWNAFVPDLVTMLIAGPDVHPYSEEKAFVSTVISSTELIGSVDIAI